MRDRLLEVDGIRLRVRITGSGRPLLLIHGLGAGLEAWRPYEELLPGHELISIDPPGIGGSQPSWRPLRMASLSRLYARLLTQLERPHFDVLGLSWGGLLAQQLAHHQPQRVDRLILSATGCGLGALPGDLRALALMLTPHRFLSRSAMERTAPFLYGPGVRRRPREFGDFLRTMGQPSLSGYYGQMLRLFGWSSLPWLRELTMPTLVLAGKRDRIVPPVNARMLTYLLPNASLRWLDDGHLFMVLRPEECAALIREFLDQRVRGWAPPDAGRARGSGR